MFKKKKNCNKQNGKASKRLPLATVPSFNLTEEIRIPTFQSNELKNLVKSIELKKIVGVLPNKKTISRKSTCKSVKQNSNSRPPELRTIMQTFKQLKFLHENSRSKSKSPASCNSRSTKKYFLKKKSSTTLLTNPNSEVNLTLKLERTIKELNQQNFFRDEDSLLPLRSNSDAVSILNRSPIISDRTVNLDEVDLNELRSFCIKEKNKKNSIQLSLKTYSSFKENRAALKIQRAWKKYLTKRLVEHYAYLYSQHENYLSQEIIMSQQKNEEECDKLQPLAYMGQLNEIMVESEQFYPNSIDRSKIRHISNLEQEKSVSSDYEQIVKRMKLQELDKWNQIISIISNNKSDNPLQLEMLLQKLTQQSQINKKDLQIKANNMLSRSGSRKPSKSEQQIDAQPNHRRQHNKQNSSSDHSLGLEQYDSKKYIDYLDSDIFPPERHEIELIKKGTISKKKQQFLLEQLKNTNLPIKLGDSSLYRSESMKSIQMLHKRQKSIACSKTHHRRSISEKILRNTLQIMTQSFEQAESSSEINIDLLTKQFLQGSDPSADNFDMVYSEEKLKSKLAELNRMKEQSNIDQRAPEDEQDDIESNFAEEMAQLRRSKPSFILHQTSVQSQIKIEEGTPQKLQVEFVQAEILSESEEEEIQELKKEQGDNCATIILNNLLQEVLRDIAKSQKLKNSFQVYSLSLRPQSIQKSQGTRKKGFPTGKGQIIAFLQSLVKYLQANQPEVFKNLEVSTGPTALEMLRYMHQLSDEQMEDSDQQQDQANVMVIPNRVFDNFWKIKERSIVIETPPNFQTANPLVFHHHIQLLKSFNKIFYRSLFDTFNQCLDCQRNFGQYGRPFPWKRCPYFQHQKSEELLRDSVEKARKKMLELSTTYCGLIIEKEQLGSSITEQYVAQVHEDRLSRMLASDLLEGEERWIFYDDEETEILVEIANALYTELIIQMVQQLYGKL